MFVAITNTPRDYAWGSPTAIAELLGTPASGGPQAELWLGTHPGSPAQTSTGPLSELTSLPFLLKVLAAAAPLSLQAHPTPEQAREGFDRENAAGIALDAPNRNYKDDQHKPELIYALTPLRALCGFRPVAETRAGLERLLAVAPGDAALNAWLDRLGDDTDIAATFEWIVSRGDGVDELLSSLVHAATLVEGEHYTLVGELAAAYPGDPGIAISAMLNLVELSPGQVLFLPAGNIHAYIEGVGVELMAASDNVLRGGLTPKHVDVPELLRVLDFEPVPVPYLAPISLGEHAQVFRPASGGFELLHVTGDAELEVGPDAIVLCTSGGFSLNGVAIARGESLFASAERLLEVKGSGELFVATTQR